MSALPAPNPYVGPRAFTEADRLRFFGREREAFDLLDLVIAERIVLLYSPSGAGKTSLLKAGLIPKLRREKFRVLPVIRVNQDPPPDLAPRRDLNRYQLSTLRSLEKEAEEDEEDALPADQRLGVGPGELAGLRLGEYLDRLPRSEKVPEHDVLIFDQFEEILTIEPNSRAGWEARHAFFRDVGDALCDRRRWAVFSLREDYIAGLDPYLRPIPTRLSNRFRLDLLRTEEAPLAITQPPNTVRRAPSDPPVTFAPDAVQRLVADLGRPPGVRPDEPVAADAGGPAAAENVGATGTPGEEQPEAQADGQAEEQSAAEDLNLYVEPLHLQVVCDRLWRRLEPLPGAVITKEQIRPAGAVAEEQIGSTGAVDDALAAFYSEEVAKVAGSPEVERRIREWFDDQLIITEQGIRGQVPEGPTASGGLDNGIVKALVEARLVRREGRLNAAWYELSHDRMIRPVRASNAAWFHTHLNSLQRAAVAWNAGGRPTHTLLGPLDLARAYLSTRRSETRLGSVERAYLSASWGRWKSTLLVVSALAVVILLGLFVYNYFQAADEDRTEKINQAKSLAGRAGDLIDPTLAHEGRVDVALLLALEAAATLDDQDVEIDESLEARQSLLAGLVATPHLRGLLPGHEGAITDVAFSPGGRWLVTAGADGRILRRELQAGGPSGPQLTASTPVPVDGTPTAAAGCRSGGSSIPNLGGLLSVPRKIALGASPGRGTPILAVGAADGSVVLRDIASDGELDRICRPHAIVNLAFSGDGRRLAIGDAAGGVVLWDHAGGSETQTALPIPTVRSQFGGVVAVRGLAFSPDGFMLAAAHGDGRVLLWNLAPTGEPNRDPPTEPWTFPLGRPVSAIAFSADGRSLAAGDIAGTVRLWDPVRLWDANSGERERTPIVLPAEWGEVTGLAFNPNPGQQNMLASSHAGGGVVLWPGARWSPGIYAGRSTAIAGEMQQDARSLAFGGDGSLLVSGGGDGSLALWDPLGLSPLGRSVSGLAPAHKDEVVAVAFRGEDLVSVGGDGKERLWSASGPGAEAGSGFGAGSSFEATSGFEAGSGFEVGTGPSLLARPDVNPISGLASLNLGVGTPEASTPTGGLIRQRALRPVATVPAGVQGGGGITQPHLSTPQAIPTVAPVEVSCAATPPLRNLVLGPDGRSAAGGAAGAVCVWGIDPANPSPRRLSGSATAPLALAFSDGGRRLVASYADGSVWTWRLDTQDDVGTRLQEFDQPIAALAADADGLAVAVGLADGTIEYWNEVDADDPDLSLTPTTPGGDQGTPVPAAEATTQGGWVPAAEAMTRGGRVRLTLGVDGHLLAVGRGDGVIVVWDLADGKEPIGELRAHAGAVTALAWRSGENGPMLASGGADGMIVRWDLDASVWEKYACAKAGRDDLSAEEQEHYLGLAPEDRDAKGPCTDVL